MDLDDLILRLSGPDQDAAIIHYILNSEDDDIDEVGHLEQEPYLEQETEIFNLDNLEDSHCRTHFRFYNSDIRKLVQVLNIPKVIILKSSVKVGGEEALCVLLNRFSYPNRYEDMMKLFPRGRGVLSEIFNHMVDHVLKEKGHVVKSFNQTFFSQDNLELFCDSLAAKGSPYKRCFGFVDGTVEAICRSSPNRRELNEVLHSIKFQSLMLPNGIIYNMFGSVVGGRHDGHLLARSKLNRRIEEKFYGWQNPPHLYGDSGYPLTSQIIVPFDGNLTRKQAKVNNIMSKLQVRFQCGFEKISRLFPFVDFKKNPKIRKYKMPQFYKVATILSNCHTCLYGSQVCRYFECNPPTLEEYLN